MKQHVWFKMTKGLPFFFCGRCGLIHLKNKETQKAAAKPCPGRETEDGA